MSNLAVIQVEELELLIASAVEKTAARLFSKQLNPEEYLTRKQVADIYKVSLPTVHQYINRGLLIAYKIQGRTLFKRTEVDEAIRQKYVYKYKRG